MADVFIQANLLRIAHIINKNIVYSLNISDGQIMFISYIKFIDG